MSLPDHPLTPEARAFLDRLAPKIQAGLQEVRRVPVSVLLWGPAVDSDNPLGTVRDELRAQLRSRGHLAVMSEELVDGSEDVSLRVQEFVQASHFDLVVCLPASPGALAEAHDFASHPIVRCKLLIFLNQEHLDGYSPQSLVALSTVLTSQIEYYPHAGDTLLVVDKTLEQVQRIRELKFMYGWKNQL